ncbi:protein tweety homolog 1-B-like isoform X5 [Lineus longissimus]|uniref:protein tweety homolog 1-B-like isoform X5 n=1 Tax=Lineus longissimus TaxID=88925 RepID=UPI00315C5E32
MAVSYETDSLVAGPVAQYETLWLSEFFHSFPHVNLSFKLINSTFDPFATSYQESVIFIASLPVIWMLLTLIALTAYFCYRCCQPTETLNIKGKKKPTCLVWTIAVFTVITCAAIGVGFFGNEEMKKGTQTFINAAESANERFKDTEVNVDGLSKVLNDTSKKGILAIETEINDLDNVDNITARDILLEYTRRTMSYVNEIQAAADKILETSKVNISKVIDTTEEASFYRWVSTIGLMSLLVVVCLLFLLAVAKASKCLIIFCTCLTVFCLVLVWTVTGAYLGFSMAVGDFCHDPDTAVEREAGGRVNPVILHYYMNCSQDISNPFSKDISQASESITKINLEMEKLKGIVRSSKIFKYRIIKNGHQAIGREMKKVPPFLQHLTVFADCQILHKDYVRALEGICHTGMAGVAFILLAGAVIGIIFTIIIILASRAWRHFGKNASDPVEDNSVRPRKEYNTIDEDDPFIPRAQNSPSYHRYGSLNDIVSGYPSYAHASPDQTSSTTNTFPLHRSGISGGRFSPPSLRMPGSTRHTGPEHLPLQGRQTPPPAFEDKDSQLFPNNTYDRYVDYDFGSSTIIEQGYNSPYSSHQFNSCNSPYSAHQFNANKYGDFYEDYNYTAGIGTGLGTNSRSRRDPNAPVQV